MTFTTFLTLTTLTGVLESCGTWPSRSKSSTPKSACETTLSSSCLMCDWKGLQSEGLNPEQTWIGHVQYIHKRAYLAWCLFQQFFSFSLEHATQHQLPLPSSTCAPAPEACKVCEELVELVAWQVLSWTSILRMDFNSRNQCSLLRLFWPVVALEIRESFSDLPDGTL